MNVLTFDEFVEISLLGPLTEHFVVLALNQMLPIGNSDPLQRIEINELSMDLFQHTSQLTSRPSAPTAGK